MANDRLAHYLWLTKGGVARKELPRLIKAQALAPDGLPHVIARLSILHVYQPMCNCFSTSASHHLCFIRPRRPWDLGPSTPL